MVASTSIKTSIPGLTFNSIYYGYHQVIRGEHGPQTLGCVQVVGHGRIRDQGANL